MSRKHGNVVSYGHQELWKWGERRAALGASSTNPLGTLLDGGRRGDGARHSDPTLACQIRDEDVYDVERVVCQIRSEDPGIAQLLFDHYYRRQSHRDLASARGLTLSMVQGMLTSGQAQVGAILMYGPQAQHVAAKRRASTRS